MIAQIFLSIFTFSIYLSFYALLTTKIYIVLIFLLPKNTVIIHDVHTKYSFDAYVFGVTASPDDAYRYAKGEGIKHPLGYEMKLREPPVSYTHLTLPTKRIV